MKIIFDSEEQKDAMLKLLADDYCPSLLFLKKGCGNIYDCEKCWAKCGLEVDVVDPITINHDMQFESGCDERIVWGKKETGRRLCKDCGTTYESYAVCNAVEKRKYPVFGD
jgi:hypothetical protein